jgi:hypothetical protein
MTVPTKLAAGDTWSFLIEGTTYSAIDGWSVTFVAYNATQRFSIDSTSEDADHRIARTAAESSAIIPGTYQWSAFAKKSPDRYLIGKGNLEVTPNVEGARPWDTRTNAKKIVEELEAAYLAYASSVGQGASMVQSYTIGDRSTTFHGPGDFITALSYWRQRVADEEALEDIKAGLGDPRRLLVRFT